MNGVVVLFLWAFHVSSSGAFVLNPSDFRWGRVVLKAKSTKRQKKAPTAAGGGFGKKTVKKQSAKVDDDYAAFPALEPSVRDSLVSFEGDNGPPDELPMEMYERLAHIYGFKEFNYLKVEDDQQEEESPESEASSSSPMSFEDLLSSSAGSNSSTSDMGGLLSPKPTTGGNDFADLLNAATGAPPEKEDPTPTAPKATDLPIDILPPFAKFRVLHVDPMVIVVEDFFTDEECDRYIAMSDGSSTADNNDKPLEVRSKTVGKDALAKAQRTSTTWFHHFKTVPELLAKASRLVGIDYIESWEEPQTVRYRKTEKFTWHLDALAPSSDDYTKGGGQRIATLLVYLTDLSKEEGGATMFRDLGGASGPLKVRPRKGTALLFFPAAGGIPNTPFDIRTLHSGESVAKDAKHDKWIAQMWLREKTYTPTAPPNNSHQDAHEAITKWLQSQS